MPKKKRKKRNGIISWVKRTFGGSFNIWDFILLFLIVGYPIYIVITQGPPALLADIASTAWAVVVASFVIKRIVSKAKR